MTPEERSRRALANLRAWSYGQLDETEVQSLSEVVAVLRDQERSEALEEAAKVVDGWGQDENFGGHGMVYAPLASAIRALKDKP